MAADSDSPEAVGSPKYVQKNLWKPGKQRRWLVAYDGSKMGNMAMELALDVASDIDYVKFLHITNSMKSIPEEFTGDSHKTTIEKAIEASSIGMKQCEIDIRDAVTLKDRLREVIVDEGNKNYDFLITGVSGRKGKPEVMGSCADCSLRKSLSTGIFVRKPLENPKEGKCVFVVSVDGSWMSVHGYYTALSMMEANGRNGNGNELWVVHVANTTGFSGPVIKKKKYRAEYVKAAFDKEINHLLDQDIDAQYKQLEGSLVPEEIAKTIADFCDRKKADFLIVGADGMRADITNRSFVGSVSDRLVRHSTCNVVVTQMPLKKRASFLASKSSDE